MSKQTKTTKGAGTGKGKVADQFTGKVEGEKDQVHDTRAPQQNGEIDETPRQLVSGGSFHDFETEPVFEGVYKGMVQAEKDNETRNQKKGDVIGYAFDTEDDQEAIIGNSHSVKKAIEQVRPGAKLRIEFLGKGESNGKPFNKFKIDLLGYVK